MNVQINSALKRARGYWFVDGFIEMAAGGLFVLLAILLLVSESAPQASSTSWLLSVAGEISIAKFVGIPAAILILWWLKDHFTYPRTGFVRSKKITGAQILIMFRNAILFLLLPIIGLFAASLLIASESNVLASMPVWFPVGLGVIWAILIVLAGEWMGLQRFRLLGILILLAGLAIGIWQLASGSPTLSSSVLESINRSLIGLSWLTLISGVVLIISGLVTFIHYRKENPTPYTEEA